MIIIQACEKIRQLHRLLRIMRIKIVIHGLGKGVRNMDFLQRAIGSNCFVTTGFNPLDKQINPNKSAVSTVHNYMGRTEGSYTRSY